MKEKVLVVLSPLCQHTLKYITWFDYKFLLKKKGERNTRYRVKIKNIQKYQEEPFSDNSVENISIAHLEDCNISRDKSVKI